MFHVGHSEFLRVARAQGTYLIVGIHTDQDITLHKGANHPIMTLQERVLGVLSCRYVDEVILGAPYAVTEGMISSLNIGVVCSGSSGCDDPLDSYAEARKKGIWKQVQKEEKDGFVFSFFFFFFGRFNPLFLLLLQT